MFYVRVDHLSLTDLAFHGFVKIDENEEFEVFHHYSGDLYVLPKTGKRFLYLEDLNDAVALNPTEVVQLPKVP